MPRLLSDTRPRYRPPGPLAINGAHPQARGLVLYALPAAKTPELVGGGLPTLLTSGNWAGVTPLGPAVNSTSSTTGGVAYSAGAGLWAITTAMTILVWADPASGGLAADCSLLSIPWASGSWANPFGLQLNRNSTLSSVYLAYPTSGSAQSGYLSGTGFLQDTDGLTAYGVTRTGATIRFFRNGVLHSSATGDASAVAWNSSHQPVTLLNRSSTSNGEGVLGTVLLAAIWNRALSDAEMQAAYLAPFAVVGPVPAHRRRLVAVAPAASSSLGSLALMGAGR